MRFRELRQLLQSIVLAGLPIAASGCLVPDLVEGGNEEDCGYTTRFRTLHTTQPAEPALQLKIDSCRVDVDACLALCQELASRANVGAVKTCDVTFQGDDVEAVITYQTYNGGNHCPVEGRRPAGLVTPREIAARGAAGAWLAQAASMEAASVHAFLHLAQLAEHGAPRALVKLALGAANDEVRHTAMVARLAERYGAVPPHVDVALPGARTLEELAIENAAEGCVRETWGAAIALWQAQVSPDPVVRETFAAIAKDEIRHAGLAWAIEEWLMPQLDEAARARVVAARDQAARELFEGGDVEALVALGLPTTAQARGLVTRTYNQLWMTGGLS